MVVQQLHVPLNSTLEIYAPRIYLGEMIHEARREDAPFVTAVAVRSGLFTPDDVALVDGMMAGYFARGRDDGARCFIIARDDGPVGAAFVEPVRATDGVHELLMIAVDAAAQSAGYGGQLLAHVEDDLRARGQRLLLVQTSGQPEFARTRAFYVRAGYAVAATIADYYARGVDMVMFRKDV